MMLRILGIFAINCYVGFEIAGLNEKSVLYFQVFNDDISKPHRDALSLLNIRAGNCVDDCDRTLYAMRACGIPVAVDGFLVSPDNGGSHRWNVLYDNLTERFIPFDVGSRKPLRKAGYPDYRKKVGREHALKRVVKDCAFPPGAEKMFDIFTQLRS